MNRSRPAIHIAPETLQHMMMAAEYAQGFAVHNKRPFRESPLWRAFKWLTVLALLIAAALAVYAYQIVNHDVRKQNDIHRMLDDPLTAPIHGHTVELVLPS